MELVRRGCEKVEHLGKLQKGPCQQLTGQNWPFSGKVANLEIRIMKSA